MPALLGRDESGNVQLQVVKVDRGPNKASIYMSPETCPFGSFMAPVDSDKVVEELAIAQIRAAGQKPIWYDINTVEESQVDEYHLADTLPLPNRDHYIAVTKLYRDFCNRYNGGIARTTSKPGTKGGALEVGTKIFLKDGLLYFFIFKQEVSGGAVSWSSDNALMDIVTGEVYTEEEVLRQGYTYAGLSHSHNTMKLASPSTIDDTQEIGTPGIYFLHSTFENTDSPISSYVQTTTLTTGYKRYNLTGYIDVLTTMEWLNGTTYHPNVFSFITEKVYVAPVRVTGTTYSYKGKSKANKQSAPIVPHGYWDTYDGYHDADYTYVEGDDPFACYHDGWQYPAHLPGTMMAFDDDMTPEDKVRAFMADAQLSPTEIVEILMEI